jgi:hypothetical protein
MLKICIAVAILSIFACSKSGGESHNEDGSIKLFLGKLEVPMFDSISVHISAPDMNDIHISESSVKDNLKIDGIPYGENRQFEVSIYADSGKQVLIGEAAADIVPGETPLIPIPLVALAGFLRLEIPLGIPNNTGVHSGIMSLNDLEYRMKFEDGKGVFTTNSLELDKDFEIEIELYNSDGEPLFFGNASFSVSSILQTKTIQLKSSKGSAVLELKAETEGPIQILAMLPEDAFGSARTPKNFGDMFFTEIFADPAEGNDYQYMELYNPTLDTMRLRNCKIARDLHFASATGRFVIKDSLILPPIDYIILGRDSALGANYNYSKSFNLLKTSQSLGLFCDSLAIDTLTYAKSGDNIFPLAKGKAMQLPLANYKTRAQGSSWCFGASPGADAICR